MTARIYDDPGLPPPPECAAALEALHRWLDRESVAIPPDVAAHVTHCPDCGGRFASSGQLAVALVPSEAVGVPPLLTERILAGILSDTIRRRRTRWMSLAGAGIAAGLIVAVWLIRPPAGLPGPTPKNPEMAEAAVPPPPDLRTEFAGAGEAVAALTRRAATDAVGAGKQLVPAVPPPAWPPPIAEPARPLGEAGAALAGGFEPVATSARRAARLVLREFSTEDEKK